MNQQNKNTLISKSVIKVFISLILLTLINCGTLGGFKIIRFNVSKENLNTAFDKLYLQYPEYTYPKKWSKFDDWSERGYDFLESKIIYFDKNPEEMFYITFIDDNESLDNNKNSEIAIRAVHNNSGKTWLKEENFNKEERLRIENRFKNDIITKLEKYTNSHAMETNY